MTLESRSYCSRFMHKETEAQPKALELVRGGAFLTDHSMLPLLNLPNTGLGPRGDRYRALAGATYRFGHHCH